MIHPSFGYWLAGLTDGEGCFTISQVRNCYSCRFEIHLRLDDAAVLHEVRSTLGIGWLGEARQKGKNPQQTFVVYKKHECLVLRDIFRRFPLRSKKARDFQLWTEALDCWLEHKYGKPWDEMSVFKQQLEASRVFNPQP